MVPMARAFARTAVDMRRLRVNLRPLRPLVPEDLSLSSNATPRSEYELPRWLWLWFPMLVLVAHAVFRMFGVYTWEQVMSGEFGAVENATFVALIIAVVLGAMAFGGRRSSQQPLVWRVGGVANSRVLLLLGRGSELGLPLGPQALRRRALGDPRGLQRSGRDQPAQHARALRSHARQPAAVGSHARGVDRWCHRAAVGPSTADR